MSYLRFPLLLLAFMALLTGLWAGLLRLGWQVPEQDFAAVHGALMICGFMGTLISLERAVALSANSPISYLVPSFAALGTIALLAGLSIAPLLMTASSFGLVLIFGFITYQHFALYTSVMGLGAVAWLLGNLLWLADRPIYAAAPFWIGFLTLTIAGERLELSRVMRLSEISRRLFLAASVIFMLGMAATRLDYGIGLRLVGVGEIALAAWMLRYDVARRTILKEGLTRFIAACLLAGYFWLGISGLMALLYGGVMAGAKYDAILHAVFLGFAFSMIFGHAPIIFPAILNIPIHYRSAFYVHLGLLHGSLLLRVIGDIGQWQTVREWGGLLNVAVLLLFLMNTALSLKEEKTRSLQWLPVPLIGILVLIFAIQYQSKPVIVSDAASEEVISGQTAYQSYCSSCHGLDAAGISGLGKNLVGSDFVNNMTDVELHAFIVAGRPTWDAANTTGVAMPPRGGNPALTDAEIDTIIAYLRHLQR